MLIGIFSGIQFVCSLVILCIYVKGRRARVVYLTTNNNGPLITDYLSDLFTCAQSTEEILRDIRDTVQRES